MCISWPWKCGFWYTICHIFDILDELYYALLYLWRPSGIFPLWLISPSFSLWQFVVHPSSTSFVQQILGGTAAAVPPPFRPGNPALCGSHPLVTPHYCRLGICCFVYCLLCDYCIFSVNCVFCVFLQYFDTVGLVFWPVKTVTRITYDTVLVETLNYAQSINQSICDVATLSTCGILFQTLNPSCAKTPQHPVAALGFSWTTMCAVSEKHQLQSPMD